MQLREHLRPLLTDSSVESEIPFARCTRRRRNTAKQQLYHLSRKRDDNFGLIVKHCNGIDQSQKVNELINAKGLSSFNILTISGEVESCENPQQKIK